MSPSMICCRNSSICVLDVVDEPAGGGQADALGLEVVDDVRAALDAAVDEVG